MATAKTEISFSKITGVVGRMQCKWEPLATKTIKASYKVNQ